jgi:hypothetical protein
VLAVVSDRKFGQQLYGYTANTTGTGTHTYNTLANEYVYVASGGNFDQTSNTNETSYDVYLPEVLSFSDYYPFHMQMPGRFDNSAGYRYGGSNGQEKETEITGNSSHYSAEYWMYDSRLGRRWNVDPRSVSYVSPYSTYSGNPILCIDKFGDTTYKFDFKTGKYIGMTDIFISGSKGILIETQKVTIRLLGHEYTIPVEIEKSKFSFADPKNDTRRIRGGKELKDGETSIKSVRVVTKKEIHQQLKNGGAYDSNNQSMNMFDFTAETYLLNNSDAGNLPPKTGRLDYVITSTLHGMNSFTGEGIGLREEVIYLPVGTNVAHNNYNFGNFLWGASGSALGVSSTFLKSYADLNNIYNDKENQGVDISKKKHDSPDDQFSIEEGALWQKNNPQPSDDSKQNK